MVRFRHILSQGLLVSDVRILLSEFGLSQLGKKANLVEYIIQELDSLICQNLFATFDQKAQRIQSLLSQSNRCTYQFPTTTRLSLQYSEPFSRSEVIDDSKGGCTSIMSGTRPEVLYDGPIVLSLPFADRIESQQTTVIFSINSLAAIRTSCGKRRDSFPRILLLARPLLSFSDQESKLKKQTEGISFPFSARISDHHDRPLDITSYCAEHVKTEIVISYCNISSHTPSPMSPNVVPSGQFVFQIVAAWEIPIEEVVKKILATTNEVHQPATNASTLPTLISPIEVASSDHMHSNLFFHKRFSREQTFALLSSNEAPANLLEDHGCLPIVASFSLICPLSLARMQFPGRTINCRHVQCFDIQVMCKTLLSTCSSTSALNDLLLGTLPSNARKMSNCPVCGETVSFSVLQVDELFKNIVDTFPSTIENVRIHRDDDDNWEILPTDTSMTFPIIEVIDLTLTPDLDYSNDMDIVIKKEETSSIEGNIAPSYIHEIMPCRMVTQIASLQQSTSTQGSLLNRSNMPSVSTIPVVVSNQVNPDISRGGSSTTPLTPVVVESESDGLYDDSSDESDVSSNNFSFLGRNIDDEGSINGDNDDDGDDFMQSQRAEMGFVDQFESQILLSLASRLATESTRRPFRPIRLKHVSTNGHDLGGHVHAMERPMRGGSSRNHLQFHRQPSFQPKHKKRPFLQEGGGESREIWQGEGYRQYSKFVNVQPPLSKRTRMSDSGPPPTHGPRRAGFSFEDPIVID